MKIVSSCLVHVDNSTLADTRITHLRTLPRFLFLYRSSTVARVVEEGKTQLGFSASHAPLTARRSRILMIVAHLHLRSEARCMVRFSLRNESAKPITVTMSLGSPPCRTDEIYS